MQVKAQPPKTNPQPSKEVGTFLSPSTSPKTLQEVEKKENREAEITQVEEEIKEIERGLNVKATLDITAFNNLAYNKHLTFKLLFITSKIYLHVKNTEGKNVVVAVTPPRWGGSSLRYLIAQCSSDYCKVIQKNTGKGMVLTYSPVSNSSNSSFDEEDIFD